MSSSSTVSMQSRRSFFKRTAAGAAMAMPAFALIGGTEIAFAERKPSLNEGDVAILQFLAVAEIVESDLWGQYCELATNNPGHSNALQRIDESLPDYIGGVLEDERSHATFINAFLVAAGKTPINLDPFRTLPSVPVEGAKNIGRLTNLTNLTVDTSYYQRYRQAGNPDFGDAFAQIANIVNQPTIPTSESIRGDELHSIAQTAAFHFASIEQGGSSLYNSFMTKATNLDVVAILASIGPMEVYHFAVFQTALERIRKLEGQGGPNFPDFRENPNRGDIMPEPCIFLDKDLPLCSVIRPRNTNTGGAVAAATGLVKSGLFLGQSQAFFDAVVPLAEAADAALQS
jgi:Ferritin-like domain